MQDPTDVEKGLLRIFEEDGDLEKFKLEKAFWISVIGIVCLTVIILILSSSQKEAEDIVSISGVLTTLLGTLVGAILGVEIGSEGKKTLKKQAALTKLRFDLLWHQADQSKKDEFLKKYGELRGNRRDL
jgi:hypothetical protein